MCRLLFWSFVMICKTEIYWERRHDLKANLSSWPYCSKGCQVPVGRQNSADVHVGYSLRQFSNSDPWENYQLLSVGLKYLLM